MCPNGQLPVSLAAGVHSAYLFGLLYLYFPYDEHWGLQCWPWATQGLPSSSNTLLAKAGKFIQTYLGNGFLFCFVLFFNSKGWTQTWCPIPTQTTLIVKQSGCSLPWGIPRQLTEVLLYIYIEQGRLRSGLGPWGCQPSWIVWSEYLTLQIFFQERASLLNPPVMCGNTCASAHSSGWWGLCCSHAMP